jgi:hypothetical protein
MDYTKNSYTKVWQSSYQIATQSGLRYRGKVEKEFERNILPENETVNDSVINAYDDRAKSNKKKSFTLLRVGSAFVDLSSMVPERDDDDNQNSFHGNY